MSVFKQIGGGNHIVEPFEVNANHSFAWLSGSETDTNGQSSPTSSLSGSGFSINLANEPPTNYPAATSYALGGVTDGGFYSYPLFNSVKKYFYVGEDGPTHQPVEHIMSLRAIPNFHVFRPSDAKESAVCFEIALKSNNTPSALLLTRQGVPVSALDYDTIIEGVQKGAYIVKKSEGNPDLVFLATGSEVSLALEVADLINDRNVRVVSVPCFELFEQQSESYKKSVIPDRRCIKISIEAGITHGWERYIGINGLSIGIDHYGLSAPYKDLAEEFGFTPEKVKKRISDHLNQLL